MSSNRGVGDDNSTFGTRHRVAGLSPREREIAVLYAAGRSSSEIAEELYISPTTVRNHVAAIYRKLEIGNKMQLAHLIEGGDADAAESTPGARAMGDPIIVRESATPAVERQLEAVQAQQRAIQEILGVICHSPGDIESILDVSLDYALRLSHSQLGIVYLYDDGAFSAPVLKNVPTAFEEFLRAGPIIPGPGTGLGRMAKQHRIIHIHDVRGEDAYRQGDPLRQATADLGGARTLLTIPMIHRDRLLGAFAIYRQQVKPFTDSELDLLQVFSDQAAIALAITRLIEDRDSGPG